MVVLVILILVLYLTFLYRLQIIEGEKYYHLSDEVTNTERTITAARGNILDRYGRVLVSNKECYNLKVDNVKLFANADPNAVILELVKMVESYGDHYTDDLPVSREPPFTYDENMTDIQRTMLKAYFVRQHPDGLPEDPSAVELLSFMRTRYGIDNRYSSEEMRIIAGVRYSINVRYAVNTADYLFVEDASMPLIASILENKLVGIEVQRAYIRNYETEYAAHILGYTAFEEYLHGRDGKVIETQNNAGTILASVYETEPTPGDHIYLTIDKVLQEQTERILNNSVNTMILNRDQARKEAMERGEYDPEMKDEITGAAAVVVKVNTGEPLAIASWPTYDVSTIIEKYQELMETPNAPLFNRALLGAYAPGSTFKPCVATAVLTEGQINTEYKIKCEGVFTKYAAEGYAPECWIWNSVKGEHYTHPEENVTTALRDSCNYFFYSVGHDLGIDKMGDYAHAYGLGVSTGIELVETVGNMSNEANHADYTGTVWRIGDTMQAAIGQSDSIFSPLQLAQYCATVANSGHRYSTSILKTVRNYDYSRKIYEREPEVLNTIRSAEYNWVAIHEGMYMVLNDWINEPNAEVWTACPWICAGKTGTAQKGEKITNDGIFLVYGPYTDPDVAIAVVVERGGSGANVQRIARRIMDAYINICSYTDSSEEEMRLLR